MAEERLPNRMGKRYTQIVLACLTCLDMDATGLGNETDFLDADGIIVAVRYIEKLSLAGDLPSLSPSRSDRIQILMQIKEISI